MANDLSTITKRPAMKLGHTSAKKPIITKGRRDFFSYRDLDLKEASGGRMRGQIMKAITGTTLFRSSSCAASAAIRCSSRAG